MGPPQALPLRIRPKRCLHKPLRRYHYEDAEEIVFGILQIIAHRSRSVKRDGRRSGSATRGLGTPMAPPARFDDEHERGPHRRHPRRVILARSRERARDHLPSRLPRGVDPPSLYLDDPLVFNYPPGLWRVLRCSELSRFLSKAASSTGSKANRLQKLSLRRVSARSPTASSTSVPGGFSAPGGGASRATCRSTASPVSRRASRRSGTG